MFFKSIYILGVFINVGDTLRDSHEGLHGEDELSSIPLNPRMLENREQLKRIVRYLNGHYDEYERTENNKLGNFVPKETDIDNNIINEQEARILAALNLLQKNYNNLLRHDNEERRPRLLYIDNPEVLEEYKSNLRGSLFWSSSDSADSDYYDRMSSDEVSGHRKFDISENGAPRASKDKNSDKHNHSRSKHKNHGPKSLKDPELRNPKGVHQKGRFKIAREKKIPQIIEGKRPKIEKKEDKGLKISDENLDASNLNFEKNEKIAANVVLKEFTKDRIVPSRPKYTEKKYPGGDLWSKMDDDDFIRKKPFAENFNPNKRGGRIAQSLGRTFIPYIATKTVYEDD